MISNCDDKLVCLELLTTRPLLQHFLVLALPHLFCSWLLPTARSSGNRRICGASVFSCQQSLVWKLHTPRIRCTNQSICWGSEQVYSVMSVPIWRFATTPNQICQTMQQQFWGRKLSCNCLLVGQVVISPPHSDLWPLEGRPDAGFFYNAAAPDDNSCEVWLRCGVEL